MPHEKHFIKLIKFIENCFYMSFKLKNKILILPFFIIISILHFGCDKKVSTTNSYDEDVSFINEIDSLIKNNVYEASERLKSIEKELDSLNNKELAYFYSFKIATYLKKEDLDSIPYYSNKALLIAKKLKNEDLETRLDYSMGMYYRIVGDYAKSLEFTLKGISLTDKFKERQVDLYNNLGGIYFELNDFELAFNYLRKAHNIAVEINDIKRIAKAYANLGSVYLMTGKYDDARKNISESYLYFSKVKDTANIIKSLTSWSRMEVLENNFELSTQYLDRAKELSLLTKEEVQLGLIYQHFGNVSRAEKRYNDAVKYYQKAYEISNKNNIARDKMNALEGLSLNFKLLNRYKESSESLMHFYHIRDSIQGIKVRQTIEALKWSKEVDDQKFENELLYKKIETEKLNRLNLTKTYIIIIVVVLAVVFFIWMLYQNKKKNLNISNLNYERLSDKLTFEENLSKAKEEQFRIEIDARNKELISLNILILAKNKIFNEIENVIVKGEGNSKEMLVELKNVVKLNRSQENDWEKFKNVFETVHPDFFENINNTYPQLSKTEVRVCSYIKIGMPSTEICGMLNINQESLNKTRYRIRRKLNLEKSENLDLFVQSW